MYMDIAALATSMSMSRLQTDINLALLSKTFEIAETSGDELAKMMEAAVTGLGQNLDVLA